MIRVFEGLDERRLDDDAEVGRGGEARVFRDAGRAFKVYHPIDSWPAAERPLAERRLALAERKIQRFPRPAPAGIVAPLAALTDGRGRFVGYSMPLVEDAMELRLLGVPRVRRGCLGQNGVLALFARLAERLRGVHAAGLVVGDLNDGNVLVADGNLRFIDADSMQMADLPCPVAHERFLDPALFGVDLLAAPVFSKGTDAYAFAVLFFATLMFVHPFGGSHDRLRTLLRRVEARHSVLRDDVRLPPSALPIATLPPALHAWFEAVFEGGQRDLPSADSFAPSYRLCSCGLEGGNARCPRCSVSVRVSVPPSGNGAVVVRRLATGEYVAAAHGPRFWSLERRGDGVVREDGTLVPHAWSPGHRAELAGRRTVIGGRGRVSIFDDGQLVASTSADEAFGETCFGVWDGGVVVAHGGWLVDATSGRRLGAVLAHQTWFRCGARFGFGFVRAGAITKYFVVDPKRGGLLYVPLPSLEGRLLDAHALFDDEHALVTLVEETRGGGRRVQMHLVTARGAVRASLVGAPDDHVALGACRGRALAHGVVVIADGEALHTFAPDPTSTAFVAGRRFPCSAVTADDDLFARPDGALVAVTEARFVHEIRVA